MAEANGPSEATLTGVASAFAAAALFGINAPFAKLLLRVMGPLMLAALLYLGGALGLAIIRIASRYRGGRAREAPLRGADFALLAIVTTLGGIAGPLLMLYGLERMSALAATLLLNLEAPFTVIIAMVVFREYLGPRELAAAGAVVAGAVILGWAPGGLRADAAGAVSIAAACACWAIDNNLTQRLSIRDPATVAGVKTLGAGALMLALATALGAPIPSARALGAALGLGAICYGLSLYFAMIAMRILGAARQSAYFASAPFIGALVAVALFRNLPNAAESIGGIIMATGVIFLARERHEHPHRHEVFVHDHRHWHDAHHQHAHDRAMPTGEPHAHVHSHAPVAHVHPHVSDVHHRHGHNPGRSAG
jgi:drug/metabolite transporter (DMT)-like permease